MSKLFNKNQSDYKIMYFIIVSCHLYNINSVNLIKIILKALYSISNINMIQYHHKPVSNELLNVCEF